MSDIKSYQIGGNANNAAIRFHEDGSLIAEAVPTAAETAYGDACDYGAALSGIVIRAYADADIAAGTTGTLTVSILTGNTKTAAGTDTAAWTAVKTVSKSGSTIYSAGDAILTYVPDPNETSKYYMASIAASSTGFTGKVNVWTELVP
ncbi:MAG: hypothetical protein WCR04_09135 [Fibrobacteraceae bacterium]